MDEYCDEFMLLELQKDLLTYSTELQTKNVSEIRGERKQLFTLLNGDVFYNATCWPLWIKPLFWKIPISDANTFKLLTFFVGNGCPPRAISKWILTSQMWHLNHNRLDKRRRQILWINNFSHNRNNWFYFDMHCNRYLYLSGRNRSTTDATS